MSALESIADIYLSEHNVAILINKFTTKRYLPAAEAVRTKAARAYIFCNTRFYCGLVCDYIQMATAKFARRISVLCTRSRVVSKKQAHASKCLSQLVVHSFP